MWCTIAKTLADSRNAHPEALAWIAYGALGWPPTPYGIDNLPVNYLVISCKDEEVFSKVDLALYDEHIGNVYRTSDENVICFVGQPDVTDIEDIVRETLEE